ncbi:acylphosphatase [Heyndrickxia sporothermodurans]|uniref:acylphosphatase n=1 Tax=Heyndrickxia sporothermodurans TaxID=46224 RepID=UPI002E24D511|nr:acylphosphatase [Heyndrickxia sporothermodurans]
MKESGSICLPQLTNDIVASAKKTKLCAYSVALEGWRRGLKLKWYTSDSEKFKDMIVFGVNPPGRLFSLSSATTTHYFFRTRGDLVTNEAVEIGSDKDITKQYLERAGVPVPKGKGFPPDTLDSEIIDYAGKLGYPLVIKPKDASLGNGVVTNIKKDEELVKALIYVRQELGYDEIIVEQYVTGKEYRVYVVGDQVVAAYNRVPANVIGDGIHTISELIVLKNEERKKNARLYSCLIEIDKEILEFLQDAGYTFESIPEKGEQIFLRKKTNVSSGGDPVDVTDTLSTEIKKIAINALKAVPNLCQGGVDIIINEGDVVTDAAVVIELNPTAQIGGALFPLKGKSRNIPAVIIDYYFPETKGISTKKSKLYFDLNTALEPLQNRSAIETEVAPAPQGQLIAKKYVVTGKGVKRQSYHEWLKGKALDAGLNGYIKKLSTGEIEILVAGTNKKEISNFKQRLSKNPKNVVAKIIKESNYKKPVKIGFEISKGFKESSLKSIETAYKRMEKNYRDMQKQMKKIEKENKKIESSLSWRITKPLRKIGSTIKQAK